MPKLRNMHTVMPKSGNQYQPKRYEDTEEKEPVLAFANGTRQRAAPQALT
jgi:hypothetical protein